MWEKNLNQRLLLIGAIVAFGLWMIWPPKEKLLPGLDIKGGVSMIFEIQEDENDPNPNLAEDMKRLLQKRVDPQGVYNLVWRVHGKNRIEVQMPLPPAENAQLRDAYLAAENAVFAANIKRSQLENLFRMPAEQQATEVQRLAGGSAELQALIEQAIQRSQEYGQALAARATPESQPTSDASDAQLALRDAAENLDDAIETVLDRNLDPARFRDVIEMDMGSRIRENSLADFKREYPSRAALIDDAVAKFAAWREKRVALESPADLQRLLRGSGELEFRILAEPSPDNLTRYDRMREQLQERGTTPQAGDTEQWFKIDSPISFFNLDSPAELEHFDPRSWPLGVADKRGSDYYVLAKRQEGLLHEHTGGAPWKLTRAFVSRDGSGRRSVGFELNAVGGEKFSELTSNNIGKQLCILVDDVAYSSANIQSRIGASGQITGDFSVEKINYLVQTMQAGSLPARLKDTPVSERTIGSSLGEQNLANAFRSALIGLAVVSAIMVGIYWVCGFVAIAALLLNILLTLAAMAMLGARFTLDGIAGIILTLGMAVDANVLIYERMREEKERGASLRMIIKNGYDKAFSTIFDSNLTTLLSAMIIYYVGSEEIKGFGLTLGWGICISMFTALFVTRTLFSVLVKTGLLKDIKIIKIIPTPTIDWYGKRRIFLPLSAVVVIGGLLLLFSRGAHDTLDVEFLGGSNAEIEVKPAVASQFNDVVIGELLQKVGQDIAEKGQSLAQAQVSPVEDAPAQFRVTAPGIDAPLLAAMISEPLEDGAAGRLTQRDGVRPDTGDSVVVTVQEGVTQQQLADAIHALAGRGRDGIPLAGDNIKRANVGMVTETADPKEKGRYWNISSTVTNKKLMQYAIVSAFGDNLKTQQAVLFDLVSQDGRPIPIQDRRLESIARNAPPDARGDLTDFLGGALIQFDNLQPPQTIEALETRLRNMRLQPDYQDMPFRSTEVFGLRQAGKNADGETTYSSVALAVVDPQHDYRDSPELWASEFALPEQRLATATLQTEQTLRRVSQFKPQIASQAVTRAIIALVFSWIMIIAYVWIRFGKPIYGVAGVIALVHDVGIALAAVGVSGLIGSLGSFLLIEDFKIDMKVIAALLTIIGFSINDTIVIFDRIREIRGRLGTVTPKLINEAVNQTFSRTIITSLTAIAVVLVMYIFGGSSVRAFNFCMLVGMISGVYSTVAIAAPLLLLTTPKGYREPQAATAPATA